MMMYYLLFHYFIFGFLLLASMRVVMKLLLSNNYLFSRREIYRVSIDLTLKEKDNIEDIVPNKTQ